MRLQVATGHWRYGGFSWLGKLAQVFETWRCDGSAPGHLALRFIPENETDVSTFYRMRFGGIAFSKTNCDSVFFDITRARGVPSFHLVTHTPWAHPTLTRMTVYNVNVSDEVVESIFQSCICYAGGVCPFVYDDFTYINGLFPVCSQCCPIETMHGHCVQLTLQILSEGMYGNVHQLRNDLEYRCMCCGLCCGLCMRNTPYTSYSPRKAILALKAQGLIGRGEPLYGENCFKFTIVGQIPVGMARTKSGGGDGEGN